MTTADTPKTITVRLDEPIVVHSPKGEITGTYAELTFRRPRGRDLLVMDKLQGELNKSIGMMASMASVPFRVFEEMDANDFARVAEEIAPLLGKLGRGSQPEAPAVAPEAGTETEASPA